MPGFVSVLLMEGPLKDGAQLYASHTFWESEEAFTAWTKSEAFRTAHRGAGGTADLYAGPPELEVFQSVQHVAA